MPGSVSEVLETVFKLTGADVGIAKFAGLSAGATTLATAENAATVATVRLGAALAAVGGPVTLVIAGLTALAALGAKATATFAEDEQVIRRTATVLKNMGNSLPIDELKEFAGVLSRETGFDDEALIAAGGALAKFGLAGEDIKRTLPTALDAAAGSGESLEKTVEAIGRAFQGQGRGLREFGVVLKTNTGGAVALDAALEGLASRFGGFGSGNLDTVGGAFGALQVAIGDFLSALGGEFAQDVVLTLRAITRVVQFLTDNVSKLAFVIRIINPLAAGFAVRRAQLDALGLSSGGAQPAAAGGGSSTSADEYARKTAENTGKMADRMGNLGPIARKYAIAYRDLNMALGV